MPPTDVERAILEIRAAVQDRADECTVIGGPANVEGIIWFGQQLSYTWPRSYIAVLEKHDGVMVGDAIIYSFMQSLDLMLVFRERFHNLGYWPIAGDGCGNYYVLSLSTRAEDECPVLFLEASEGYQPVGPKYSSYAAFVTDAMKMRAP